MIQDRESLKQPVVTGRPGSRPDRQEFVKTDARLGPTTNLGSIIPRGDSPRAQPSIVLGVALVMTCPTVVNKGQPCFSYDCASYASEAVHRNGSIPS
jgi:hypothetical protein